MTGPSRPLVIGSLIRSLAELDTGSGTTTAGRGAARRGLHAAGMVGFGAHARSLSWRPPPAGCPGSAVALGSRVLRTTDFIWPTASTVTSSLPTGMAGIQSGSRTAGLGSGRDRMPADTGERDPYGRQTGKIWLIDPRGRDVGDYTSEADIVRTWHRLARRAGRLTRSALPPGSAAPVAIGIYGLLDGMRRGAPHVAAGLARQAITTRCRPRIAPLGRLAPPQPSEASDRRWLGTASPGGTICDRTGRCGKLADCVAATSKATPSSSPRHTGTGSQVMASGLDLEVIMSRDRRSWTGDRIAFELDSRPSHHRFRHTRTSSECGRRERQQ